MMKNVKFSPALQFFIEEVFRSSESSLTLQQNMHDYEA